MSDGSRRACITGIGLVSSLGEGIEAHWERLSNPLTATPEIDEKRFSPYPVHPLVPVAFAQQIPRTTDQRQMERWQRIGTYAAGLALADAGIAGDQELLDRTDLSIAAGNGERDIAFDEQVLARSDRGAEFEAALNQQLMTGLRPTLYLGQLSNLLAANISIVHGATGASRTFKGEEMAGVSAVENATARIESGEADLVLAGGAFNAEREDILLACELEGYLYRNAPYKSVWERREHGGGAVLGSVGAFLVIESASHARARGRNPYAQIGAVRSDWTRRRPGEATAAMARIFEAFAIPPDSTLAVLSGASGIEPVTSEERAFIAQLRTSAIRPVVRAFGSVLGHTREAHFLAGVALAAIAIAKGGFYPPFSPASPEDRDDVRPEHVLVTALGSWRGEGAGILARAE